MIVDMADLEHGEGVRRRRVAGLEVLSAGEPSERPPVLLVHGAWHGAWCWARHVMPYLADAGWEVHALSLRGHGGSPADSLNRLQLRDYADDVTAVAADLGRVVLVGHSMGGAVVQRLLCRRDRPPVVGAALLASVPPRGVIRVTAQVAREEPGVFAITNLTVDLGRLVASREQVRNLFLSADADDEVVGWLHQRVQKESYLAFLGMLTPHRPRRRPSLPVLVLGAANDRIFTVPEVEATAAAWGTTAHIVPGLAHDVMLDSRWMDAADVLEAWLRRSMTLTNGH